MDKFCNDKPYYCPKCSKTHNHYPEFIAVFTQETNLEWTKLIEEMKSLIETVGKKLEPYLIIIRICEDTLIKLPLEKRSFSSQ
jgi:hypothetical protein